MPITKKYSHVYDEDNAVLISESKANVVSTGVALRAFLTGIPAGELDGVIQEMWSVRLFVDNPKVDRRAGSDNTFRLQGRWRVASLRKHQGNEKPGIYEELKVGYLQPPGTSNDYPMSSSATDWSNLDPLARVIKIKDAPSDIKTRLRTYYVVMYQNVAQATVQAFTEALIPRGTLTNPSFNGQTALSGTFNFINAYSEDQNDGSSVVIGVLSAVADPANAADIITTGTATATDATSTLEGQTSLTAPGTKPTVAAPGPVVTVSNRVDPATNKWVTTTKSNTPTLAVISSFAYYSEGIQHLEWEGRNLTLADLTNFFAQSGYPTQGTGNADYPYIQPKVSSLTYQSNGGDAVRVSASINEYGYLDARITASRTSSYMAYGIPVPTGYPGNLLFVDVAMHSNFGKMWRVTTKYYGYEVQGQGAYYGRLLYDGLGNGTPFDNMGLPLTKSSFRSLGRDWYQFTKILQISTTTKDVTTAWKASTAIDTTQTSSGVIT